MSAQSDIAAIRLYALDRDFDEEVRVTDLEQLMESFACDLLPRNADGQLLGPAEADDLGEGGRDWSPPAAPVGRYKLGTGGGDPMWRSADGAEGDGASVSSTGIQKARGITESGLGSREWSPPAAPVGRHKLGAPNAATAEEGVPPPGPGAPHKPAMKVVREVESALKHSAGCPDLVWMLRRVGQETAMASKDLSAADKAALVEIVEYLQLLQEL